jgi:hypothetical protein
MREVLQGSSAVAVSLAQELRASSSANLIVVSGRDNLLVSVAAVAAGWIDRQQLVEVDLSDGSQFLRRRGSLEAVRQSVEPGTVFVLEGDQGGNGRRPALRPRQNTKRRRRRSVGIGGPTPLSRPVARLALGRGHRQRTEARSRHRWFPLAIVTSRFPVGCGQDCFCVRPGTVSSSRPEVLRGVGRSRGQGWPARRAGHRRRRLGLEGGEPGARLGRVGGEDDHAACRKASFLRSKRCCMFR